MPSVWSQEKVLATPNGTLLSVTNGGALLKVSPPVPSGEINGANGTKLTFMLHNLGADTSLDPLVYVNNGTDVDNDIKGYLYQWGRATDGHQLRRSDTTNVLSSSDNPLHGDFIANNASPYDWRSPFNKDLWQINKGPNDPCPTGYRVPTSYEWSEAYNNNTWTWTGNGYSIDANGDGSPELYLPAAGSRSASSGNIGLVGVTGNYWSSTVVFDNINGEYIPRYLNFLSSNVSSTYSSNSAYGRSVRCIAE